MSIMKSIFGDKQEEVWRQFCSMVGDAEYVDGGLFKDDRAVVKIDPWTVVIDTYATSSYASSYDISTRIRAPYINVDEFRFQIYEASMFSGMASLVGMQDVKIGDTRFDDKYVIKGTDEARLKQLFAGQRLRALVLQVKDLHLEVKDDEGWFGPDFPDGCDELIFQTPGVVTDINELKVLYELFAETLNRLCLIGSAVAEDAGVEV